ncbi:MAG: selenide, water dikinase SelD [Saprospiraceae bacterium]|nr:selenide, water dikinase SelD [Saprospiraceae bacterium]
MGKEINEGIRLTAYSHGSGCGCKLSPGVLDSILKRNTRSDAQGFPGLLVGYDQCDDAAVFDLGDGTGLVSTTDFFMPVVDEAYDFGRIASANALSDVYAMGGRPLMALGILGWPIDKLPVHCAAEVIEGARAVCREAGIPLAGGHSIDCPEPLFGLAVSGRVCLQHLKTNASARPGDVLFLTKGLGIGILTTAGKKGILLPEHAALARASMLRRNDIGVTLGKLSCVHAMTDITGFGLCGHLLELCSASACNAKVYYDNLPLVDQAVFEYIGRGAVPGGTGRNWASYGQRILLENPAMRDLVADPQTSGGLLIAVDPVAAGELANRLMNEGLYHTPVGVLEAVPADGESSVCVC